jgi:hypothetical protein
MFLMNYKMMAFNNLNAKKIITILDFKYLLLEALLKNTY